MLSDALNLAEGNDRQTQKDRKKFFNIALTSLREVQSIIDLENLTSIHPLADQLDAMIYRLLHLPKLTDTDTDTDTASATDKAEAPLTPVTYVN